MQRGRDQHCDECNRRFKSHEKHYHLYDESTYQDIFVCPACGDEILKQSRYVELDYQGKEVM